MTRGNVPKFRFRGFEGEWEEKVLKDICTFFSGGTPTSTNKSFYNGNIPFIGSGNIYDSFVSNYITEEALNNCSAKLVKIGDLLYALYGANSGEVAISKLEGAINQAILCVRTKSENIEFIYYLLLLNKDKIVAKYLQGGQGNLSADIIKKLKYGFPSLLEQERISSFLSTVDEKTQQLSRKKELLEQYKKGVMQQLFSGKLRFKDADGKDFADWKFRKMSEVLFEHKLNSTGKEEVFSVSVHKGLINQVEHLGRVFAAKNTDNYNLVKPGDMVYTKSPTGNFPLGIIKQNKINKDVIVSPLYGVFTPETNGLGYMLNVYFESPVNVHNYLASIIQKGAKNTINITNTTFLSKKMKLPVSKEEQNKIGSFLEQLDKKIEENIKQLRHLQTYKKGLLQQMFV